jgi:hypothetical protein
MKRNGIRFTCVSLFHYKISLPFFRFFSLLFASNFSLRFDSVIFASKRSENWGLFFRYFSLLFALNFSLRFDLVIFASKRNKGENFFASKETKTVHFIFSIFVSHIIKPKFRFPIRFGWKKTSAEAKHLPNTSSTQVPTSTQLTLLFSRARITTSTPPSRGTQSPASSRTWTTLISNESLHNMTLSSIKKLNKAVLFYCKKAVTSMNSIHTC